MSYVRAVLYELQPTRFSDIDIPATMLSIRQNASILYNTVSEVTQIVYEFVKHLDRREWTMIGAFGIWLYVVRFAHRVLDAGPMAVILSALVLIFTIGLDDGDGSNNGGVSAYSVFNRGFQRLMGSVDVENLVAQHVGGALAVQAIGAQQQHQPPPRQGQNRAQRRAQDRAVAEAAANENVEWEQHDGEREGEIDERRNVEGGADRGQVRRSNKKNRKRRNLEQRREMQRQRQAAAAMGFGGNGEMNEAVAMNRLLDDQVVRDGDEGEWDEDEALARELQQAEYDD